MQRRRSRRADTDVFVNCPFDDEYESLYVALIAGLCGLGLTPRCVLEIPGGARNRLDRIFGLIHECGSSVHDLSRTTGRRGLPRFNMPFELGLAVSPVAAALDRLAEAIGWSRHPDRRSVSRGRSTSACRRARAPLAAGEEFVTADRAALEAALDASGF